MKSFPIDIIIENKNNLILTIPTNLSVMVKDLVYAILSNHKAQVSKLLNKELINEFFQTLGSPLELANQIHNLEMIKLLSENKYIEELSNTSISYWHTNPAIYLKDENSKHFLKQIIEYYNPFQFISSAGNRAYTSYEIMDKISNDNPLEMPYHAFSINASIKKDIIASIKSNYVARYPNILGFLAGIVSVLFSLRIILHSAYSILFYKSDIALDNILSPVINEPWHQTSEGLKLEVANIKEVTLDNTPHKIYAHNIKSLSKILTAILNKILNDDLMVINNNENILIKSKNQNILSTKLFVKNIDTILKETQNQLSKDLEKLVHENNNKVTITKDNTEKTTAKVEKSTAIIATLQPVLQYHNPNSSKNALVEEQEIIEAKQPQEIRISKKSQKTTQVLEILQKKQQQRQELTELNRNKIIEQKEKNKSKAVAIKEENTPEFINQNPLSNISPEKIKENDLVVISMLHQFHLLQFQVKVKTS
ncbi:hypothetical protein NOVO_06275 [Rickettsiales bacterium Ac37b]|nr:hypothetical protein NOVO_06275 [Rickettsiales bacterium Ac37b]